MDEVAVNTVPYFVDGLKLCMQVCGVPHFLDKNTFAIGPDAALSPHLTQ
jgi:hypothetical protein